MKPRFKIGDKVIACNVLNGTITKVVEGDSTKYTVKCNGYTYTDVPDMYLERMNKND